MGSIYYPSRLRKDFLNASNFNKIYFNKNSWILPDFRLNVFIENKSDEHFYLNKSFVFPLMNPLSLKLKQHLSLFNPYSYKVTFFLY